jgi:hypothetical protein
MVPSNPCLALYCSISTWFIQPIWDSSSPTTIQPCTLIPMLFLLILHFYDFNGLRFRAYAMFPTTCMCATHGLLMLHVSSGVMEHKPLIGHQFWVQTAFAIVIMVWFAHSVGWHALNVVFHKKSLNMHPLHSSTEMAWFHAPIWYSDLLKPLEPLSFGFSSRNPHVSQEIINENNKNTLPLTMTRSSWGHKHSYAQFPRVLVII